MNEDYRVRLVTEEFMKKLNNTGRWFYQVSFLFVILSSLKGFFGHALNCWVFFFYYSFMFKRGWFLWLNAFQSQELNSKEEPAIVKLD